MKLFRATPLKDMMISDDPFVVQARKTLEKFCREGSSRPKKILYNYLERELGVQLKPSNTASLFQTEHPRFECTNKYEFCKITFKLMLELKTKNKVLNQG